MFKKFQAQLKATLSTKYNYYIVEENEREIRENFEFILFNVFASSKFCIKTKTLIRHVWV